MQEFSKKDLRIRIATTLASAPKHAKRALEMPSHVIADHLMKFIFDGLVVLRADTVGCGDQVRGGSFGRDEPHPLVLIDALKKGPSSVDELREQFPLWKAANPQI